MRPRRPSPEPGVPRSLRHVGGTLRLLDQRALPQEERDVECATAVEVAAAIRAMVVRGAPAIGVAAAFGVALDARRAAEGGDDIDGVRAAAERACAVLEVSRPTAVNLAAAVHRMRRRVMASAGVASATELVAQLEEEARVLERFEEAACRTMGRLGADLLPAGARVVVHCNAGALATVGTGTALAAVYEAHRRGRLGHVFVDETRPRLQGARLTAWELGRAGVPHTVVVDSYAATLMREGAVDAALVGADRIAANGDVANKVGTYALAVACAHHDVPLYVVAPTTTLDLTCETGDDIPIEERGPDEVARLGRDLVVPPQSAVLNRAFDVTPASLVTALVTERGLAAPPGEGTIEQLMRTTAD